jgi:CSLREA domain-containing protein
LSTKLESNGIGWTNVRHAVAWMAALLVLTLVFAGSASAATYTVTEFADDNGGEGDCPPGVVPPECSLREAVTNANNTPDDDVVVLSAGTYELNPSFHALDLRLGAAGSGTLVVRGAGARSTTVHVNPAEEPDGRAFVFSHGATSALEDLSVTGGSTDESSGGAILVEGFGQSESDANATLTRVRLHDNTVVNGGGGAIQNDGKLLVDRSLIDHNEAEFDGGGIRNSDELTLVNSTVTSNESTDEDGGGVSNDGFAAEGVLSFRAFSHNGADEGSLESEGLFRSENSTIAFNRAPQGNGAGVATRVDPCAVNPSECETLTGDTGGPISRFHNSIVSDNSGSDAGNCIGNQPSGSGDWTSSEGYNLEDGDSCAFDKSTDLDQPSGIAPLANNGGQTDTHKLNAGSAAINAGEAGDCPTVDQRDATRPQRGGCDIGAFELDADPVQEQPQQEQPQQLPEQQTPEARGPRCLDSQPPLTNLDRDGLRVTETTVTLSGTSRDRGLPCASGVERVEVSMAKVSGTDLNCRFVRRSNRFVLTPFINCRQPVRFVADGTTQWQFRFRVKLKPGKYRAQARGYDEVRNKETPKKRVNIVVFTVK